jgi:hypothetical protein
VRLLHPSVAGAARRPVYVAVLSRATPFLYLAIPYSRFATPAVPGEMEASRAARPLRVWCAWNARLLHAAALASGWVADRLTVAECRAGLAAVAVASGERAAEALEAAAGPPLSHPADPRHIYLRQESALMDAVVACGAATGGILLPWPAEGPPAAATVPLARAAEAPEAYRREICYRVVGSDVVLRCAAATAGQPGCIEVQTPGGAASQLLDGAVIATRRRAVTIASGRALLRGDERAGGFTLFSADGRPLRLV